MKHLLLVVDDTEAVLELMGKALRRGGYDVLEASSGPAALELLDRHGERVSAIVTDVYLNADMTGTDLAVRVGKRWSRIPILYTSGDVVIGKMEHFLAKPFDMKELVSRVEELIEGAA